MSLTRRDSLWPKLSLALAAAGLSYFFVAWADACMGRPGVIVPLVHRISRACFSQNFPLVLSFLVEQHFFVVAGVAYIAFLTAGWVDPVARKWGLQLWWTTCGLWVVFLVVFSRSGTVTAGAFGGSVFVLVGGLALGGIACAIFHFHPFPKAAPGHCRNCGYDLRGNESGRCPECGMQFTRHFRNLLRRREPR